MVAKSKSPWKSLTGAEKKNRIKEILVALEDRKRKGPAPKTTGEFWDSSEYLQAVTILAYSVLGPHGRSQSDAPNN
jgi:hypothetical protein